MTIWTSALNRDLLPLGDFRPGPADLHGSRDAHRHPALVELVLQDGLFPRLAARLVVVDGRDQFPILVLEAQDDVRHPLFELALVDAAVQVVELQLPFGLSLPESSPQRLGEGEVEVGLEVGIDDGKKTVGGVANVVQGQLEGPAAFDRLLNRRVEVEPAPN